MKLAVFTIPFRDLTALLTGTALYMENFLPADAEVLAVSVDLVLQIVQVLAGANSFEGIPGAQMLDVLGNNHRVILPGPTLYLYGEPDVRSLVMETLVAHLQKEREGSDADAIRR